MKRIYFVFEVGLSPKGQKSLNRKLGQILHVTLNYFVLQQFCSLDIFSGPLCNKHTYGEIRPIFCVRPLIGWYFAKMFKKGFRYRFDECLYQNFAAALARGQPVLNLAFSIS